MQAWQDEAMSQTFGIEAPKDHIARPQRMPVRYVVVIDSGGEAITRLFLETRQQVDEFAGGAPEVVQMVQGLTPRKGADGPQWDEALKGHSMPERIAADVYILEV